MLDNADRHGGGVIRVAVLRGRGHARIEVDDAGPGVPTELQVESALAVVDRIRVLVLMDETFGHRPAAASDIEVSVGHRVRRSRPGGATAMFSAADEVAAPCRGASSGAHGRPAGDSVGRNGGPARCATGPRRRCPRCAKRQADHPATDSRGVVRNRSARPPHCGAWPRATTPNRPAAHRRRGPRFRPSASPRTPPRPLWRAARRASRTPP
ncbi:ATP-binding protein [Pseudonocardia eucalypti]|uniref:ATP-binding protein n=1 Tax=Pseudonocardia eucalypti TaxID=648755 RepID=UPI0031E87B8E